MARILMLAGRLPFPTDDGWKIRTASLLRGLAEAGHEMHLLSFVKPGENAPPEARESVARLTTVPRLKAYASSDLLRGLIGDVPFLVLNYRQRDFTHAFERLTAEHAYAAVLVEDIVMAQYAVGSGIPVRVLDMHNIESDLLRRFADGIANPLKALYARITADKLARYERATADRFHTVLTCSAEDRDRLLGMDVHAPIHITPNGVRTAFYDDIVTSATDADTIAFVGSMDYHANISGVVHFVRNILPLILRERPSVRFLVVGKNPPPQISALASSNVVITGGVEDVRPYLARACVIVVPLLVGGGTRLKILEAMASGRPVVSTHHGAEGITAGTEHLVVADDEAAFAAAVVSLMDDPARQQQIGRAARAFVSRCYDWSIITNDLNEVFAHLLTDAPAG